MKFPKVVLFDMDNTLIDHETASDAALIHVRSLFPELQKYDLASLKQQWRLDFDKYWLEVIKGGMTLEESYQWRFQRVLSTAGRKIEPGDLEKASVYYRDRYLSGVTAMPGSLEVVRMLKEQGIKVGVITNNTERMQSTKLDGCGFSDYLDYVITSESCGILKPDREIFLLALGNLGASPDESVMVGDSYNYDILGAINSGIHAVWFNRNGEMAAVEDSKVKILSSFNPAQHAFDVITRGNSGV
jgi:putative hydrolase of the HAD superfamily